MSLLDRPEHIATSAMAHNRILYLQYTNPAGYPPLEHSSRILADAGWKVLFLGTGAAGAAGLTFPPHTNVRVESMGFCPAGWRQKLHFIRYILWTFLWVLRWRPRWVYASDLLACPAALLLSYLPGLRVVYHEHDSPQVKEPSRFVRLCLAARRRLARRAALCVLPNTDRARQFKEQTGATDVCCVWNCPTINEVGLPRTSAHGDDVWLLYHGSISPPQLPSSIIDALALLPSCVKLRVIGYETIGHLNYMKELQDKAYRLGVAERLQFLGTMPTRSELLDWCGQCDVGLALFTSPNLQPMPGASNKPFDYLARGLPLLVADLPDWLQMYVDPGYALACDPEEPQSIVRAVLYFIEYPEKMRAMGEAGRQRIHKEWNYEAQFRRVWHLLTGEMLG